MVKDYFLVGKNQQGYLDALETIYKNNYSQIGAASIEEGRKNIHALKERKINTAPLYHDENLSIVMKRLKYVGIKVIFQSKGVGSEAYLKKMKDAYLYLARQFGATD